MESFGLWYKLVEDKDDKIPEFDLHVNFWFLGDILKGKVKNPYLDIGIKIKNYKNLSNLVFSFPFQVPQKSLVDLASKMSVKNNASIVFNIIYNKNSPTSSGSEMNCRFEHKCS